MWFIATSLSYLLNAVVSTIDKFLISKKIPDPVLYAFYISFLSFLAVVLLPFGGFSIPSLLIIFLSLIYGALFIFGLLLFFESLKRNEPSRVVPIIGSFVSLFTVILSFFILKENFSTLKLLSIIFLIAGGFLISFTRDKKNKTCLICGWPLIICAAFTFALSYVLTKYIYLNQPFVNGFFWGRVGSFIFALCFLLIKETRQAIQQGFRHSEKKTSFLFLVNQGVSAVAFLALNFAISLGSVSLTNALQGIQYVFIFLIAFIVSKKLPHLFEEETSRDTLIQKIAAIILIGFGLFLLAL